MRQVWDKFTPYPLKQRGSQDVPNQFLQNAHWREDQGSIGYYARSGLVRRHLTPVEFNQDHLCWVELHYSNRDSVWTAFCIAESDLGLQIPFSVLTPEEHLHLLGGDAASEDRSPRIQGDKPSSSQTEENDETTDMESELEEICVQQPISEEELRLIQRAESCCAAHSAAYRRWRLTFMKVLSRCRRGYELKWKLGEVMYLQSPTW